MNYLAICMFVASYFSTYEKECVDAISFVNTNTEIRTNLNDVLNGTNNAALAISIVLPEISQYSHLENIVQTRLLYVTYLQCGQGNFSVGYFQMKPSFAQKIESLIQRDKKLSNDFGDLIIKEQSDYDIRYERLTRLNNLKWELRYLEAFFILAERRLRGWPHSELPLFKLKYLSTLYNGGLDLSLKDVEKLLTCAQFPHLSSKSFNYSSCAIEFYERICKCWGIKVNMQG